MQETEQNFEGISFENEEEEVAQNTSEEEEVLEEEEASPEEEGEEGEDKEEKKSSSETPESEEKRQLSTRKFIAKLQRERLRAEQEARGLRERVAHLEETTSYMNEGVLKQQALLASEALKSAKLAKKQAHEMGDTDAIIEADQQMGAAMAQLEYLKMIPMPAAPKHAAHSYQEQEYASQESASIPPSVGDWVSQNPWFDQRSPEYDPDKAASVMAYAGALDDTLMRQGRNYEFFTPQYFSKIDHFARQYDHQYFAPRTPRNLQMKPSLSHVSPVKNSPARAALQREKEADLTSAEKEMAHLSGVSEAEWKKYKKQTLQEIKQKGGNNVYR